MFRFIMAETTYTKDNHFSESDDGKFLCLLCNKMLSTKQRVLTHLHKIHMLSPLKRVKKRYLEDQLAVVPKSTRYRWNKQTTDKFDEDEEQGKEHSQYFTSEKSSMSHFGDYNEEPSSSSNTDQLYSPMMISMEPNSEHSIDENSSLLSFEEKGSDDEHIFSDDTDSSFQRSIDSNENYLSDDSLDYSLSSLDESLSDEDNSQTNCEIETISQAQAMPKAEFQALSLLSCFLRNKFSASTSRDVIDTLKKTFSDSKDISNLDHGKMMSYLKSPPMIEIHYCIECKKIFPEDENIFRCTTLNCDGLRYKGPIGSQQKNGRQAKQYFVMADLKNQLINLLQTEGIWEEIEQNKEAAYERAQSGSNIITDIMDGSAYQEMVKDGGFLDKKKHNITAVFNTDGINLYSSSKTELWPIFLAINELGPSKRFSRNNIILAGLWQGKGKPPFGEYFKIFSENINHLHTDGVDIHIGSETYNVKLAVLCGITDLPAKAEVLNMSYFNGEYACILCEDPGITVKQGKGSSRCFPYRIQGTRFPVHNHEDVVSHMQTGSIKNRCKGFKGISGLTELHDFDIVKGMVPDYMHGVLMGVTKVLLNKWFSPSNSHEEYFIGRHMKSISEKMKNIKPPDSIERLPRDLEKNFLHFKATELQTWLLYYAIPCVKEFLPEEHLENLTFLSDGIYILLGDEISPQTLSKAADLLDQFHSSFPRLYGEGSCGLNVHNIGVHLSQCVRLWGPIWAWSCFPFEDSNALLLQAVHGTGLVLKQVLNYMHASLCIRRKGLQIQKTTTWKITYEASNCDVAGSLKKLDNLDEDIQQQLETFHSNFSNVLQIQRIIVNSHKFYSEQYSRMQKRICSVIMYGNDEIGAVEYFVLCNGQVFGVVRKFVRISQAEEQVVSDHLIAVKKSNTRALVDVEKFKTVLVFLNTNSHDDSSGYIARMPNKYGHAVFK